MKNLQQKTLGASLLEVMLVLVIAALILLLSIRYYQNAQQSTTVTYVMAKINAITSAMDQLTAGATNGYLELADAATANLALKNVLGTTLLKTDWGTTTSTIVIDSATAMTANTYTVKIPAMPPSICYAIRTKLAGIPKFLSISSCSNNAAVDFTYTYDNSKFLN